MVFKRLSVDEMARLSLPWVTPGDEANVQIMKTPLLAALYPHLQVAHVGVYQVNSNAENQKVWRLCEKAGDLDARHDELLRGIHATLTMLAQTTDLSDEYLRLRNLLLPEGLAHADKTYREESVHAAMVAARLDTATHATMRTITVSDQTLDDLVMEWLDCAKRLGAVEEERKGLSPVSASLMAEINTAKLRWIRTVKTLLAASLLVHLDPHAEKVIFGPLRLAEQNANLRSGHRPEGIRATGTGRSGEWPAVVQT